MRISRSFVIISCTARGGVARGIPRQVRFRPGRHAGSFARQPFDHGRRNQHDHHHAGYGDRDIRRRCLRVVAGADAN